jgi:hypothetical protein
LGFYKQAGLPIAKGLKWNISGSHFQRMPQGDICDDTWAVGGPNRDGVYPIGDPAYEVPIDHPNGLCYTTTVLLSLDEFEASLALL